MRCQQKYVITENRRVQAFFEKNEEFFDIPIYCKKECALAHSRAEARLPRQPSTLAPSAHPRGACFYFIGRIFPCKK